jgi:hypothetical protein
MLEGKSNLGQGAPATADADHRIGGQDQNLVSRLTHAGIDRGLDERIWWGVTSIDTRKYPYGRPTYRPSTFSRCLHHASPATTQQGGTDSSDLGPSPVCEVAMPLATGSTTDYGDLN